MRLLHAPQPTVGRPPRPTGLRAAPPVEVTPVRTRRDLRRFLDLPYRLYRDEPRWVPPLRSERRRHLDRRRNPFFEHAEAEYLLAWRDGEVVGRVSAHRDDLFDEFQGVRRGLFGFFEAIDDPAVAGALIGAAEAWARERCAGELVGPMDFTTNHECGLLVEGHELPPQVLENWHHPYYARLLEGCGLRKAMDLLKWEILRSSHDRVLPVLYDLAGRLEPEHGITVRHMRRRDLEAEMRRFAEVYNAAWAGNWGFVPLTDAELGHAASELKPILDERWAWVAERGDEPVGIALTLRDVNKALAAVGDGRLLPLGWLRGLRAWRRVDEIRVFALGVKPAYQHTGVAASLYVRHWETALRLGIKRAETGWILETNGPMNRAMEALGGSVVKRYRVYSKALAAPRRPA